MADINKISPGRVLWDVRRAGANSLSRAKTATYRVVVKEVHPDADFVVAEVNGNPPQRYSGAQVRKWRVSPPGKS
jgi:hypothetical protein